MPFKPDDIAYMRRALRLARKALGLTSPNPVVGAVIVKNGKIVAEDYHKKSGEPHAEALAIAKAGSACRGATLYVSLEPCCHRDKKTPPCVDAIISSGIQKVYSAMLDPNPKVSGKGFETLRRHGIEVIEGLCKDEAYRLNEAYCKYITTGLPFVFAKVAMTLDGKIADHTGNSKWISCEKSRQHVHKLRKTADAIITGIGTVLADNPQMTARTKRPPFKNPIRIVIDPYLKAPEDFKIFNSDAPTTIVLNAHTFADTSNEAKIQTLKAKGVKFITFEGQRVNWHELIQRLAKQGITSVMIEAGASLTSSALLSGVVDKVIFIIAPKIMGGKRSLPAVAGEDLREMSNLVRLKGFTSHKVADDIWIEGYIDK